MKSLGGEEEETAASVLRFALHHQVSVLLGTAAPSAFLSLRSEASRGVRGEGGVERGEVGRRAAVESNCCSFNQSFTFSLCASSRYEYFYVYFTHHGLFLAVFVQFKRCNKTIEKQKTFEINYKNI